MRAGFAAAVTMFVLIAGFFAWALLIRNDASRLPSALIDKPAPALNRSPLLIPDVPGSTSPR